MECEMGFLLGLLVGLIISKDHWDKIDIAVLLLGLTSPVWLWPIAFLLAFSFRVFDPEDRKKGFAWMLKDTWNS